MHAAHIERNSYTKAGDANALEFHSDQGATDLIALLSIAAAQEGGESLIVSAIAIHNELLRRGRKVRLCDSHVMVVLVWASFQRALLSQKSAQAEHAVHNKLLRRARWGAVWQTASRT
jgi:hypothetical protein